MSSSTDTSARPERRLPQGMSRVTEPTPGIEISSSKSHSLIACHGAHVLDWTPAGAEPVLWVSPGTSYADDAAIRGGVPICFPWFGAGSSGDRKPSHGVARLAGWRTVETGMPDGVGHVLFELKHGDISGTPDPDAIPEGVTVDFSVGTSDRLRLDLTVTAGAQPFTYSAALHTYFRVGDVRQVRVEGLEGSPIWDKAAGGMAGVQDGAITFTGEVDRIAESTGAVRIIDPVLNRTIVVTKRDSASTIVWNPGAEKAAAMSDVPGDSWTEFVCVETGNVPTGTIADRSITLQPGESHTMSALISLLPSA